MGEKDTIELSTPKPNDVMGVKFIVRGKIPKSWLSYGLYGLGLSLMDVNGHEFMGTSAEVIPGPFFKFRKKVRFYSSVDLSHYEIPKYPRGLIIEISGSDKRFFLVPVIIKGTAEIREKDRNELKEKLSNTIEKIVWLKKDWESYRSELQKIRRGIVYNREILEGIFEILEQSENSFEAFSESEEDRQEKALEGKYQEAIRWYGPLLRGVVGRMEGFEFIVYSGDHNSKHFHVIHKGRGIDARFSYPQVELISYKGRSNTIGSKESNRICEFFRVAENLKKLDSEFQKQLS